jgi:hypothetical protein
MSHELQLLNEGRQELVRRLEGTYNWLFEVRFLVRQLAAGEATAAPVGLGSDDQLQWYMKRLEPIASDDPKKLLGALSEYQPHFSLSDRLVELIERLVSSTQTICSDARFAFVDAGMGPDRPPDGEATDYRKQILILDLATLLMYDLKNLVQYLYLSSAFSAREVQVMSPPALFTRRAGRWVYDKSATPALKESLELLSERESEEKDTSQP